MSASGTFRVDLRVRAEDESQARRMLETWCVEQSIEVSPAVVDADVRERMVGSVGRVEPAGVGRFAAELHFALDLVGGSATQFLSLLYGNGSLLGGYRVVGCEWDVLAREGIVSGPSFGVEGVRRLCGSAQVDGSVAGKVAGWGSQTRRALTCTALKPIGYSAGRLAEIAREFALGGIDLIKDDHGLFNQPSAPFSERVSRCVEAVGEANSKKTGRRTLYFPNVTGDGSQTLEQFEEAVELGADGVLLIPHLSGPAAMREMARRGRVPVMAHPAFSGSYIRQPDEGFPASFLYGQLWRAFGADLVVYPNAGGRFPLTEAACVELHRAALDPSLPFRASFPTPGGGIRRETVGRWARTYGPDTVFLIGGSLYEHPDGIRAACQEVIEAVG